MTILGGLGLLNAVMEFAGEEIISAMMVGVGIFL